MDNYRKLMLLLLKINDDKLDINNIIHYLDFATIEDFENYISNSEITDEFVRKFIFSTDIYKFYEYQNVLGFIAYLENLDLCQSVLTTLYGPYDYEEMERVFLDDVLYSDKSKFKEACDIAINLYKEKLKMDKLGR